MEIYSQFYASFKNMSMKEVKHMNVNFHSTDWLVMHASHIIQNSK